jgi:hypothetical protein
MLLPMLRGLRALTSVSTGGIRCTGGGKLGRDWTLGWAKSHWVEDSEEYCVRMAPCFRGEERSSP